MSTQHFMDSNGDYIGGFDGSEPENGIPCSAPPHGDSNWDGTKWNDKQEKIDRDAVRLAKKNQEDTLLDSIKDPAVKTLITEILQRITQ